MITLSLDRLPPSTNHMYAVRKGGGKVLAEDTQSFYKEVWALLSDGGKPRVPDGPLIFRLRVRYPNGRKQDLDNRLKASQDALMKALHFDDSRIAKIDAEVEAERGPARCVLTLEAWQ